MYKLLDFLFGDTQWMVKHRNEAFWEGWREGRGTAPQHMLDYLDDQDIEDFDTPQELLDDMQSFLRLWEGTR